MCGGLCFYSVTELGVSGRVGNMDGFCYLGTRFWSFPKAASEPSSTRVSGQFIHKGIQVGSEL